MFTHIFVLIVYSVLRGDSVFIENILKGDVLDKGFVEMYIPTLQSNNEKCRNDSLYYARELKKYKLWATEMFDATTKFPSGVLYGSNYDFGNFDECIEIRIPTVKEMLYGKYCMAKFTVNHKSHNVEIISKINQKNHTWSPLNMTVWDRIEEYLNDRSKSPRNELRFSFCIPSSCSNQDLRYSLEQQAIEYANKTEFKLDVELQEKSCQVSKEMSLDFGDKVFLSFSTIAVMIVVIATVYDFFTKQDNYSKYKFTGKAHNALICFSFLENFKKFTNVDKNVDGLNCMAGMKVYSMFLIILLHRNMFDFGSALSNPKFIEEYYTKPELTFILNGPILVDTFFTVSGFLSTYLLLHYYYKKKRGLNIPMLYFHRYVRMAPTYAVILAFYCTLLTKMGSGPMWQEIVGTEQEKCRRIWWANLLFINNYVDTDNYCMFQSWYMACDMNAFLVVPIICLILSRKPLAGVTILLTLIVASVLTIFVTVYIYDELPILLLYQSILLKPNQDSTFLRIYIPGHMRATSYLMGVLTGYIKYYMNAVDYKIPKKLVTVCWIATGPILIISMYTGFVFYLTKVPSVYSALYACLYHFCWSSAIAWMIIAISSGYGPWINPILSWPPLVVLGRLTYTVYLCHSIIQLIGVGGIRHPNYASNYNSIHSTAADIILAYILAFLLSMIFETPITQLEKVMLWQDSSQKSQSPNIEMGTVTELPTEN